jgi:hypothetical protein
LVRGFASVPPMLSAASRRIRPVTTGKWIEDTMGHDNERRGVRAGKFEWLIVRNAVSPDPEAADIDAADTDAADISVADSEAADIETVDLDAATEVVGTAGDARGRRSGDLSVTNSSTVAPAPGSAAVKSVVGSPAVADGGVIAADAAPGAAVATTSGPAPVRGPGADRAAAVSASPGRIIARAIKIG